MASIELIKASDGSGNANIATVQSTRAPAATTIDVDTVLGINAAGFAGSMGTPHTFIDPITAEEITVISEATCVDFTGHVDGSNLEIDDIAPGYTDLGSAVGDIVIIRPTTQYGDNLAETLGVAHADDGSIATDTIAEKTPAAGVTVDGLLIKDSKLGTNNSVVTANITADAVTDSKLIYGKLRSRQGGSATNWQTVGTTSYDYSAVDTFMQAGSITGSASADVTVTFPTAFNQVPIVVATCTSASGFTTGRVIIASTAASNFTFRVVDETNTKRAETIDWIAIGQ